jgi:hypothetical protein
MKLWQLLMNCARAFDPSSSFRGCHLCRIRCDNVIVTALFTANCLLLRCFLSPISSSSVMINAFRCATAWMTSPVFGIGDAFQLVVNIHSATPDIKLYQRIIDAPSHLALTNVPLLEEAGAAGR